MEGWKGGLLEGEDVRIGDREETFFGTKSRLSGFTGSQQIDTPLRLCAKREISSFGNAEGCLGDGFQM